MGAAADTRVDGLAIGIESRVDHALEGSVRTGGPALEIRGIVIAEVAIDHRDHHRVAQGRLVAGEARFNLAVLGAAVSVDVVAVVTFLAQDYAVAAPGGA